MSDDDEHNLTLEQLLLDTLASKLPNGVRQKGHGATIGDLFATLYNRKENTCMKRDDKEVAEFLYTLRRLAAKEEIDACDPNLMPDPPYYTKETIDIRRVILFR